MPENRAFNSLTYRELEVYILYRFQFLYTFVEFMPLFLN